jgi:hypothetical protein
LRRPADLAQVGFEIPASSLSFRSESRRAPLMDELAEIVQPRLEVGVIRAEIAWPTLCRAAKSASMRR